jgi:antitoxin MazE
MITKVQKWGNSFAVRLPRAVAEKFSLHPDSPIEIESIAKGIIIKPSRRLSKLTSLLADITPDKVREFVDWGRPVGKEILPPWKKITTRRKAK